MDDAAIRTALKLRLATEHAGEDALIVDELGLNEGEARVDLAVVNGALNGYEIKSDLDTLNRLPNQRDVYGEFFDTVTLVVAEKHLKSAKAQIPEWWGIIVATTSGEDVLLHSVRAPTPNEGVSASAVVKLLWRSESVAILESLGRLRGLRNKSRDHLWFAITANCPPDEVKRLVREQIKARGDWRSAARRRSNDDSSRLVAKSLHSPVRQRQLHNHQYIDPLH